MRLLVDQNVPRDVVKGLREGGLLFLSLTTPKSDASLVRLISVPEGRSRAFFSRLRTVGILFRDGIPGAFSRGPFEVARDSSFAKGIA